MIAPILISLAVLVLGSVLSYWLGRVAERARWERNHFEPSRRRLHCRCGQEGKVRR